jgi:hypothetical protein
LPFEELNDVVGRLRISGEWGEAAAEESTSDEFEEDESSEEEASRSFSVEVVASLAVFAVVVEVEGEDGLEEDVE